MSNREFYDNYNMLLLAIKQFEDFSSVYKQKLNQLVHIPREEIDLKNGEDDFSNSIMDYNIQRTLEHSNELDKRLVISIAALLMAYSKDKIVAKENNEPRVKIKDKNFQDFISYFDIIVNTNNKAYIGEIEFASSENAFHFLRNKLLHGEYEIINGFIKIKKKDKVALIDYHKILTYALQYEDLANSNTKEYRQINLICEFKNLSYMSMIKKKMNNAEFANNLVVCFGFNFRLKGNRVHNLKTISLCKSFIKEFKELNIKNGYRVGSQKIYETLCDKYSSAFAQFKITPELKRKKVPFPKAASNNMFYNAKYLQTDSNDIDFNSIHMMVEDFENRIKTNPTYFLISLLEQISTSSIQLVPKVENHDCYYVDPKVGISLIKFYASVIYPSENILWNGDGTNIIDVFNGKVLDFSQLDLSSFNSTGNVINDKTWSSFESQKNGIIKDCEKKKIKSEQLLNNLVAQFEKEEYDKNIAFKILSLWQQATDEYEEAQALKNKLDLFDYDKFMHNLNVVFHIRNTIAHGNYQIHSGFTDDGTCLFSIEGNDIYKGVSTYSFTASIDALNYLSEDIRKKIGITYNEEGIKEIVDASTKSQLLNASFVDNDKKEEWIDAVNGLFLSHDDKGINIMKIAMEFAEELNSPFTTENLTSEEMYNYIASSITNFLSFGAIKGDAKNKCYCVGGVAFRGETYQEVVKTLLYYIDKNSLLYTFIFDSNLYNECDDDSLLKKIIDETKSTIHK